MKPASVDYVRPQALTEAMEALAKAGEDAKVLAGGQSLLPLMNLRLARPSVLVDIADVPEMKSVYVSDNTLCIGAALTNTEIENIPLIQEHCPVLVEAIPKIAHPPIRHRGTIGGSLAHADGAAELPALLTALNGYVIATSTRGSRKIGGELFVGPYTTSLAAGEIITEVVLPTRQRGVGYSMAEFAHRPGDFALVGSVAKVTLAKRKYTHASVCFFGVGGTPAHLNIQDLLDRRPSKKRIREAVGYAVQRLETSSDIHASGEYRHRLAIELATDTILQATERAQKE